MRSTEAGELGIAAVPVWGIENVFLKLGCLGKDPFWSPSDLQNVCQLDSLGGLEICGS